MVEDKDVNRHRIEEGDWEVTVAMFRHQEVMVDSDSYPWVSTNQMWRSLSPTSHTSAQSLKKNHSSTIGTQLA
jgi:hypothetical protein